MWLPSRPLTGIIEFVYQALHKNSEAHAVTCYLKDMWQSLVYWPSTEAWIQSFLTKHEMKVGLKGLAFRSFDTNPGVHYAVSDLHDLSDVIIFQLDINADNTTNYFSY